MLLLNALRLLLSMKVLTVSATRAGPILEIKARPSLRTAFAAASTTLAASASTCVIRCTILDSLAGRRLGSLEITGILAAPVTTDLRMKNLFDGLPSTI